jgi:transposase
MVATAMDPLVPLKEPKEPITVTPTEIIYHRRVRVLEHAGKTSVAEASRVFGVSRTTIHRWRNLAESYGLDALIPKGRRAPAMPNATPTWVVEELLAEAVVRPTLGARRYADLLAERGFVISRSGVQKLLNRHSLGRRRQRVAALAQLTATTGLVTEPALEAVIPVDLGQKSTWRPNEAKDAGHDLAWLLRIDLVLSWALAGVFLAAVAGWLKRTSS